MGTKHENENGPNPFFSGGTKNNVVGVNLLAQRFCFGMISTN